MNILAVDPGKATGYATLLGGKFYSSIAADQLIFLDLIECWIELYDVVICEDYIVTQQTIQKSRQNYSLEIIGTLRWLAHRWMKKFILQTPSQAKSFATDEKLKKLGWWHSSTAGSHDNDAARHLLVYCVNNGIIKPEELL